jgi:hypothetical protein
MPLVLPSKEAKDFGGICTLRKFTTILLTDAAPIIHCKESHKAISDRIALKRRDGIPAMTAVMVGLKVSFVEYLKAFKLTDEPTNMNLSESEEKAVEKEARRSYCLIELQYIPSFLLGDVEGAKYRTHQMLAMAPNENNPSGAGSPTIGFACFRAQVMMDQTATAIARGGNVFTFVFFTDCRFVGENVWRDGRWYTIYITIIYQQNATRRAVLLRLHLPTQVRLSIESIGGGSGTYSPNRAVTEMGKRFALPVGGTTFAVPTFDNGYHAACYMCL